MNPACISSAQICSKPFRLGFRLPPARSSPPYLAVRVLQFRRGIRTSSAWDDKPYEVLSGGRVSYLDEQDIVSFLDPPKDLIPIDPASYNPAAYLWKKLGDIPEERRHRLLSVLNSRFIISRIWEVAGTRYQDAKAFSSCLDQRLQEGYFSWQRWGHIWTDYPCVRQVREVMSTEQPCDLAYEFGNGLLDLQDFPEGFPVPAEHPSPFDDDVVMYIRHAGPGVMVGQAWQEGKDMDQVPNKLCGEILIVKDYPLTD